ncbi:MAG: hypothetical protein RIF32_15400 [Leptospirales bacterium]|jgi:hypothetical protein
MNTKNFKRLIGGFCVAGGIIAMASAVCGSYLDPTVLNIIWDVEDTFIMLGLIGISQLRQHAVGPAGLLGFSVAMIGLALLIGPNESTSGVNQYPYASSIFLIGLLIFAWTCRLPRWVQFAWVCTALIGLPAHLSADLYYLYLPMGVVFGIGFIGAGVSLVLDENKPFPAATA